MVMIGHSPNLENDMKNAMKYIVSGLALTLAACSPADASGQMSKAKVETIIQDYLMENPEIIREALIALNDKEERQAMAALKNEIFNDKRDVVIGPDDAKVTIVEFFDYNCGFCKQSTDWLMSAIDEHPKDVRVIFKELPLLDGRTKTSRTAAKAALAAGKQGKYREMHVALMTERSLTADRIDAIAKKIGLNMDVFRSDMGDPKVALHLEENMDIARQIPMFSGTPFFMINDEYLSGANTDKLDALLKDALDS